MSARLMLFLSLLFLSLHSSLAGADPVRDLYAAEVPVADQSATTRANALQDALGQVLVKLTGSNGVLETDAAANLMKNPGRYLQQYRYAAATPPPAEAGAPRLVLHAEFDGRALEQSLRSGGVPLWGRERPLTLLWVAVDDAGGRRLLGRGDSTEVAALERAGQRRGVPLRIPAMDADDATRVSFMDVWGVFEEPLLDAAGRYSPDAVLAGSIFRAGDDLWAGRWTLLRAGSRARWEVSGATPADVAAAAIDALAEHYAREFAVYAPLDGNGGITVEVTDVGTLEAYATVQSYLAGLSVVRDVRLLAIEGETLRLALELNGTSRALEQTIALGRLLEPVPDAREVVVPLGEIAGVDFAADRVLRYRYRR